VPTPDWRPPKRRALFQQGWSAADTRPAVQAWSVVEWSSRGLAAAHTTMATSGAAVRPVTAEEANPDHYSTLVSMVALRRLAGRSWSGWRRMQDSNREGVNPTRFPSCLRRCSQGFSPSAMSAVAGPDSSANREERGQLRRELRRRECGQRLVMGRAAVRA